MSVSKMISHSPEIHQPRFSSRRCRVLLAGVLLGAAAAQSGVFNEAVASEPDSGVVKAGDAGQPCPPEMVNVNGEFCVDRYETSLVDTSKGRLVSPYYCPAPERARRTHNYWKSNYNKEGTGRGKNTPPPVLPEWQMNEEYQVVSHSTPNAIPNGYLNALMAEQACQNARKRLCGLWEWRKACKGEGMTKYPYGNRYRYGKCNYERFPHPAQLLQGRVPSYKLKDPRLNLIDFRGDQYLRRTGEISTCASRWGGDAIYDMVGNLDEWALDRGRNKYVIVGGSYARDRKHLGCTAKISSHSPDYEDYSLGTRCCKDIQK